MKKTTVLKRISVSLFFGKPHGCSLHELRQSGRDKAVIFSQFTSFLDVIQVNMIVLTVSPRDSPGQRKGVYIPREIVGYTFRAGGARTNFKLERDS